MCRYVSDNQAKLSIWLQSFYHIALSGSFSKAAKKLGQSRSTLTNHVFELESLYSVRLINRTTRSFSLSREGDALFEQCKRLNMAISESHEMLRDFSQNSEGLLRVKIPSVLDNKVFHALLSQYKKSHPNVILDIMVDNNLGDLVAEKVDVALHLGELPDSNYICKRLTTFNTYVVASKEYWRTHPKPSHPSELINHPCIRYRHCKTGNKWSFSDIGKQFLVDIGTSHICDSDEMLISFALDGSGIATALDFTSKQYIEDGTLETCLEEWTHEVQLNALLQHRDNMSSRVRNFIDALITLIPSLNT
ncbi:MULTISPECIES: LysR family transcriptional regulator [Pseudoalteromonas]|uniref:LysR family transcriptional regulator n=1 Tax=Pseudoalteromonas rubra TaxID=43658 RepID=A0A0L0EPR8_9GAMM|nr:MULTISPECIES: LysR family transcriptional regulator [Pseudoalteromonas]ALU43379.1 LysR family transcriptional regulator [Pseudoalteromonas rubra]KNC66391.1 LysR family transcriptional regulator [Pseudoalteromonas rubra]MDK1312393.1 LysR family transcriptional regulator [Pseudoalteromonas sp. R96]